MPLNIWINCADFFLFFIVFFVCALEMTRRKTPTYLLTCVLDGDFFVSYRSEVKGQRSLPQGK